MAQALALEKAREISKIKAAARDGAEEKLIQHKTWQLQNKIEALPMQWETGQEGTVPRQVQQLQDDFDKWVEKRRNKVALGAAKGCERLTFEGSPYLSSLSCPYSVSEAHLVGTEVLISLHGLERWMRFS